jgi:UPF0716 family protein affecting phage T7 exclusion
VLLLAGSLLLIFPGTWSDAAGILCFLAVVVSQRAARREVERAGTVSPAP